MSAVYPFVFCAERPAPALRSAFTQPAFPPWHAAISAVHPS